LYSSCRIPAAQAAGGQRSGVACVCALQAKQR
jgi:hypothetical protein